MNVGLLQDMGTSNCPFLTMHPGSVLAATEQLALVFAHKFSEFTAALTLPFMVEFLHVLNFPVI